MVAALDRMGIQSVEGLARSTARRRSAAPRQARATTLLAMRCAGDILAEQRAQDAPGVNAAVGAVAVAEPSAQKGRRQLVADDLLASALVSAT